MKISIYRANALGDLIVALPALRAIRNHFAEAHITYVGTTLHQKLSDLIPVDEVITADQPSSKEIDLAIQMHGGGAQSNPLVASWGARESVGFQAPGAPGLDRNLPYTYFQHEIMRFLELAAFVGAMDLDPSVQVKDSGDRSGPVVIHPGARDPRRRWPAEKFCKVISSLDDNVVLIGDHDEISLCQQISSLTGAANLAGKVSISELIDLLQRARLVIANDSGPRHLAEALGTPTVGIFWIGNLINTGPLFRQLHRTATSWKMECPSCGAHALVKDGTGMPKCGHSESFVTEVEIGEVLEQSFSLLKA